MMRILLVAQFFPPDITAAAFRLDEMCQLLAAQGHEIRVLTSVPHKAQVGGTKTDLSRAVQIFRTPLFPVGKGGAKRYILHYLSFVLGSIWKGVGVWWSGWRPDVVWTSSPPLFVGLTGRFLSMLFRRPLVFEVRDIWPDTAVAAGQLPGSGPAYKIGKWMELYFYRKAAHIVCVAQPMRQRIAEQTATPVSVAYNGVLRRKAEADIQAPVTLRSAEGEPRSILYAGNLGHLQELDLLVQGFGELVREGALEGWNLRLLGAGQQKERLQQQIENCGLSSRASIEGPVSREQAMLESRRADLLYLNLKKDPVLEKTIPSKVFDCLLAGRPIVAGIAGEGCEILAETGANVSFEPGNLAELKNALRKAVEHFDEIHAQAPRNVEMVLERFTREKAVDVLTDVFGKVVGLRK
jgi:glycosyltransferase involved in cell wall biosynthesis